MPVRFSVYGENDDHCINKSQSATPHVRREINRQKQKTRSSLPTCVVRQRPFSLFGGNLDRLLSELSRALLVVCWVVVWQPQSHHFPPPHIDHKSRAIIIMASSRYYCGAIMAAAVAASSILAEPSASGRQLEEVSINSSSCASTRDF